MAQLADVSVLGTRLAHVYADAAIAFLRTGEPHGIYYSPDKLDFEFEALEPGTSPTDVDLWVGEHWQNAVGSVAATTNPRDPNYSETALRQLIADRLSADSDFHTFALQVASARVAEELDAPDLHDPRLH